MKKVSPSDKIYLRESKIPGAGRGVYTKVDIKKGELIESCPIVEIPKYDASNVSKSFLVTYFFYFGKKKERVVLALGYGSLYNHSDSPNTKYKIKFTKSTLDFMAAVNIKKGEEITVNYKGSPKNTKPLWFVVKSS